MSVGRDELHRLTVDAGERAQALIREFTAGRFPATQMQDRLREIEAALMISRYWDALTGDPANVACLDVLQMLASLAEEVEHQIEHYGENSLWDDLEELENALRRVRAMQDTISVRPTILGKQ